MHRIFWIALVFTLSISSAVWAVSFSADSLTPVMPGQPPELGKIYYKDSTTYRSEAMGIISIVQGESVYSIVTDTKKYSVQSLDELRKKSPMSAWGDATEMIKNNNLKKIGKEKLQGYKCDVYEGNLTFTDNQPPLPVKLWYSKKLKNMLKQEITLPSPMGVMTSHLENIKIGNQSNSLFEVPAGFTKVKDINEAMGTGNIGALPQGTDGEQIPSEEEMKKMMEQMQNMMKNMNNQ